MAHVEPGTAEPPASAAPSLFEGLVSEDEYARQQKRSQRTIQRERRLGLGPPFIMIGRKVFYRVEAVRAWLLELERKTRHSREQPTRRRAQRDAGAS